MIFRYIGSLARCLSIYALPFAMCLIFFFPVPSQAHAVLLSSDPVKDAVLASAPIVVRMQFSEDLNPTFSTAVVVNAADHRVDLNDAQISSDDSREMDISLKSSLPSDVYVVIWQTQSADDGHVLRGSFLFKVLATNGDIPLLKGAYPGQNALGGVNTSSGLYTGQMDGPTLFSLVMITLADLSVVFWVGAQLWRTFVSTPSEGDAVELHAISQSANRRFELFFSIPTLLVTLIANLGILIGQGLLLTGGNFVQVFLLFGKLLSDGRFGTFWTIREVVVLLALLLAIYIFWSRQHSSITYEIVSWINLALGLALLTAVTLSGHAAASNPSILVYSVLGDWLHLLAASLWIGGMMYLAVIYLPALKGKSLSACTQALLTTLPQFSPLAIAGIVIMALTGPFNATVHMSTLSQLITTAYGRALLVKVLCVGALLVTSAIHVLLFRPRLNKTFNAYQLAQLKVNSEYKSNRDTDGNKGDEGTEIAKEAQKVDHPTSQEIEELEGSVARQTERLTKVLHWEPLLGVAVLICTGLMNVFAGTLQPVVAQPNQAIQPLGSQGKPFSTTIPMPDGKFTLKFAITPNSLGTNLFTVYVLDSNGKQDTNVGVSLYTTMLDMNMGTDTVNLRPNGKGGFSAKGDISMDGSWQVRVEVRTPDNTLHEATIKFFTPY